jgi:hypothetical protein
VSADHIDDREIEVSRPVLRINLYGFLEGGLSFGRAIQVGVGSAHIVCGRYELRIDFEGLFEM